MTDFWYPPLCFSVEPLHYFPEHILLARPPVSSWVPAQVIPWALQVASIYLELRMGQHKPLTDPGLLWADPCFVLCWWSCFFASQSA